MGPYDWLPAHVQPRAFVVLLLCTMAVFVAMNVTNEPLKNALAPQGIVSFQLVGPQHYRELLSSWDSQQRLYAAFNLGLDFLFAPLYGAALSLGCVLVARSQRFYGSEFGGALSWGMVSISCVPMAWS
jgi:hypothetical protein